MKITCRCNKYVEVENPQYNVSVFENKPVLKRRTDNGEKIVKELVYHYVCPQCERDVVEIHRYKRNAAGNLARCERELLVGAKASEYLIESRDTRKYKMLDYKDYVFSKGIPLRYGKTINNETVRLRYVNEAGYDGEKIESKVKVLN